MMGSGIIGNLKFVRTAKPVGSDSYTQRVTTQAVDLLYHNFSNILVSIILMPIIMLVVMWGQVDHAVLLAWCGTAFAITAVRLLLNRAYLRRTPATGDAPRWGHYFSLTALASGTLWGSATLLFFIPGSTTLQIFLFTSIIGLCAGSIALHSYWLESYYAFTIPALSLSGLRLVLEGNIGYQGLAILFMLITTLAQVAHNTRKSALAAIRLRFKNLDLVERLHEEKEKAEIASRDKTRFLASASHDLRQPVHALTLFANALCPHITDTKAQALLGNMNRSIEALNQLLESLLDISKLDADIIKPDLAHFPLHVLLHQLDAEYAPQAQAKGLHWRIDANDLVVYSDPVLLETLLRNLISNALRYTHNGSVKVLCTCHGIQINIEIADTGVGIPSSQHKNIFREFYQLVNSERDRSKGLGLGLAIVDRLATLLQHHLHLDSTPGLGSRFTLTLPAGDPGTAMQAALAQNFDQHDVRGMCILVIDDEAATRAGMNAVLEAWGCIAMLAGSEEEALEKITLEKQAPQVIIVDYRLRNGKTGVQAIERLRRHFGSDIPALIITGDTAPDCLHEAQASGHTLMHKPVQPGKLRAYLRRVQCERG
ncbi:MAG: hybrid sensor histidine kinase/response regulator [Gallionellaceae bacterium]|nr:hybrid sensor histidine kinase/response regulator [Gallionellaceae bacterium]